MTEPQRIRICFPGMDGATLFDAAARDNCLEPFIVLRERLRSLGCELESMDDDDLSGLHALWFWDVSLATQHSRTARRLRRVGDTWRGGRLSASSLMKRALASPLRDRLALFLGEPPVVTPANWDRRVHRWFRTVFTWHDPLVDGQRYVKYFYPLPEHYPVVADLPFPERKLLVNVSGNKSSAEAGELYSARERSIRAFEHLAPADFDLFGVGWERGGAGGERFPSFRGRVAHKWIVLPRYRFSLCYENQQMEGYVTEKLFDCLRCGVIPVYLGAPEIARVVDPRCFVDRRAFADDVELLRFLRAMPDAEFRERREAAKDFLASTAFRRHLSDAFAETICGALRLGVTEEGGLRPPVGIPAGGVGRIGDRT